MAWAGPEVDLGAYGALLLPSSNHELYDPMLIEHRTLSPAPVLGLRARFLPVEFLGLEAEGDLGAAGVSGAGGALLAGWRASLIGLFPVNERLRPFLLAGSGYLAVSSADDALGRDNDGAFHAGLGAEIRLSERLRLRPELRDYLTGHYQVVETPGQHFEALIGLTWVAVPPGNCDPDLDGFGCGDDRCPDEAEVVNGWNDTDGCPDALSSLSVLVLDPDGNPTPGATIQLDGTDASSTDAQGNAAIEGRMPGSRVTLGVACPVGMEMASDPEPIDLVEGETARTVRLAWRPGAVEVVAKSNQGAILDATVSLRGPAPHPDVALGADGQEVFVLDPGVWTLLVSAEAFGIERREVEIQPNERSLVVIEVELAPPIVKTTRDEVVLLEAVQFDFDKATVKAESLPLLDEIANNLLKYTEIRQVEVQGHTDSKGSDRYNQGLSQDRVNEVRTLLEARGVASDRLTSVGYGEKCLLAGNDTEDNRSRNRRVQIFILEPSPAEGVPCHAGVPARKAASATVQVTEPAK